MPRRKDIPKEGPGVAIMAAVFRHHDPDGRQHTAADAARAVGVPYATMDRWIRLGTVPDFGRAAKLAGYMGISLDDLAVLYFGQDARGARILLIGEALTPLRVDSPAGADALREAVPVEAPAKGSAGQVRQGKAGKRAASGSSRRPRSGE